MLYDKLADTVLERGILLPHPQDSYEVLEERLLEALELPVRPRATILKCGHYMGPLDIESPSSDEEENNLSTHTTSYLQQDPSNGRKWCDICRKDVKLENTGEVHGRRRFNVKIYAGNGLMRAGAWAAAWTEMERVDVEIEPWVETNIRRELEEFAACSPSHGQIKDEDGDGFVDDDDEDDTVEIEEAADKALEEVSLKLDELETVHQQSAEEKEIIREFEEEERKHRLAEEERLQHLLAAEKTALQEQMERDEEQMRERAIMARPASRTSNSGHSNYSRRTTLSEDRMREIYGHAALPIPSQIIEEEDERHNHHKPHPQARHHNQRPSPTIDPNSLPDLLFAAFKVVLRDKKNIAIGFLSILVLLLALKPHTSTSPSLGEVNTSKSTLSTSTSDSLIGRAKDVDVVEKESVVRYVTVTATSTSVKTVEADPVVVTLTKEVAKESATHNPPSRLAMEAEAEEEEDTTHKAYSSGATQVSLEDMKVNIESQSRVSLDEDHQVKQEEEAPVQIDIESLSTDEQFLPPIDNQHVDEISMNEPV